MFVQTNQKNEQVHAVSSKSSAQKTSLAQTSVWHIDREMIPFKLHFFLFIGAMGASLPYITIFGKNRIGITASSQAAILTTQMFLFIFTKPILGYIADYFNKLKTVICILSIMQAIFFFLILLIPKIQKGEEQVIHNSSTPFHDSNEYLNSSSFYINCSLNREDFNFCNVDLKLSAKNTTHLIYYYEHLNSSSLFMNSSSNGKYILLFNAVLKFSTDNTANCYEYLNFSSFCINCSSNREDIDLFKTALMFRSENTTDLVNSFEYLNSSNGEDIYFIGQGLKVSVENETEFYLVSFDFLSKLSIECSNQCLVVKNITQIPTLSNDTDKFWFSESNSNIFLPIILCCDSVSSCKLLRKSTSSGQNIECECSNQDLAARNISIILTLSNVTKHQQLNKKNSNMSFPISLCNDLQSFCKFNRSCKYVVYEKSKVNQDGFSSKMETISDFQTYQFWIYALLTTVGMSTANGLFTLSDTACCESVEKFGAQFGRQRMYGAVGWGSMSAIGGLLNDYTHDFTAAWILMLVMSIISLLNMLRLELVNPKFSQNLLKDVSAVLQSKEFLAFKMSVLLNGVGSGVVWYYLVWYLTTIGGSRFLCGMVHFTQCFVGELPFMFYSGWFIKKLGHFNIMTLALLSYTMRFLWYSYLTNPWLVLPMEVLHGFTYGIFYPTVASYAKLSAKPGTEATTQAVLFTSHEGLGAAIGCVVAGVGFDNLGGPRTFFFLSMFAGCGMIASIILHLCIRGRKGIIDVTSSQMA